MEGPVPETSYAAFIAMKKEAYPPLRDLMEEHAAMVREMANSPDEEQRQLAFAVMRKAAQRAYREATHFNSVKANRA
jgi:hypothetical protein